MPAGGSITVRINIRDGDADDERLDRVTGLLLREVRELGVDTVARPEARPREGAGSGVVTGTGALVVALSSSRALVALVRYLRAWTERGRDRAVRLECDDHRLDLTAASLPRQRQATSDWVRLCGHSLDPD